MTRSCLVYLPGYPYSAETLMPQHGLAAMATALQGMGHETQVRDLGTVEELASLTAGRFGGALMSASAADLWERGQGVYSRWHAHRRRRTLARLMHLAEERRCDALADELAEMKGLDFIAFFVPRSEDLPGAVRAAAQVRARGSSARLIMAGRYAEIYAKALLTRCPEVDACLAGDLEVGILSVTELVRSPERGPALPNLVVRVDDGIRATLRREPLDLDQLPVPRYDRNVYPTLGRGAKFRVMTIQESRGSDHVLHTEPGPPIDDRHVRIRSARQVCAELRMLGRESGARVFHFAGEGTPAPHFDAICYEILAQGLRVLYSKAAHIRHTDPRTLATWEASGCRALSFRIDTGSQRLLDDYYGHEFGVSVAEQVLRACNASEVFSLVHLTFPCPEDDYHSLAETMRLMRRGRPGAVQAEVPELLPGSDWCDYAREFGFRMDKDRLESRAFSWRDPFAAPGLSVPYGMKGRTKVQIQADFDDLHGELTFEAFPTEVSELEALIADVMGEEAVAGAERLRHLLQLGDAEGLTEYVQTFNDIAVAPANTVPFIPLASVRAVVGN